MGLVGHEVVGLICVGIASLCFGSNFVVTKKYEPIENNDHRSAD